MSLRRLATAAALSVAALLVGCGPAPYEIDPATPADVAPPPGAVQATASDDSQGYQGQDEDQGVYLGAEDEDLYADTDPVALTDFRATLDPYGTWVDDDLYGTVWVPSGTVVGPDFVPYVSAGHWSYGDEWIWVSDYDWGWAPFHYGRWVWINGRGWAWIPGRRYSGAWVSWRYGDGYLGWAPLAPTWYWYGGYAVTLGVVPVMPYVFCPYGHAFHPHVGTQIVVGSQVPGIAARTRPWYPAQPGVGRTAASPKVNGPPPKDLGIAPPTQPLSNDRGMLKAQQFAKPSTAIGAGARPPTIAPAPRGAPLSRGPSVVPNGGAYRPSAPAYGAYRPSAPAYGSYRPSTSTSIGHQAPAYVRPPVTSQPIPGPVPGYARPTGPTYSSARPSFTSPSFSRPSSVPFSRPSTSMPSGFSRPSSGFTSMPSSSFSRPSTSMPSSSSFSRPSPSFSRPSTSMPSSGFRPSSPSFSRPSGGGGGRTFARPR